MTETNETLVVSIDQGVAVVRMNRPHALNAFNAEMAAELLRVTSELRDSHEVRVVVLTGTGRGFCSGVDINEDARLGRNPRNNPFIRDPMDQWGFTSRLALAWHEIDKPTIAAVNGVAAGGGFAMSLLCDIRIAAESARFYPMFIQRATSPEVGSSWTLPRIIGLSRAFEWMYTGDPVSGPEAAEMGLVSRTVPDDKLEETVGALARRIADGPPLGLRLTKRTLIHGLSTNLRDHLPYETLLLGITSDTEDGAEGRNAIKEKRKPIFKGR